MEVKAKRTAREIKVETTLINNKNINVKIGTVENRDAPETIYIFISFWAKPLLEFRLESQDYLKNVLDVNLTKLYRDEIKSFIESSECFTNEEKAIYIKNIPENINYNNKRNFLSIELYLHTVNINGKENLPLSDKKDTSIFNEAIEIANIIGDSEILSQENEFNIHKKSMG